MVSDIFYFHPYPSGNNRIWRAYFSIGWFNHQLVTVVSSYPYVSLSNQYNLTTNSPAASSFVHFDHFCYFPQVFHRRRHVHLKKRCDLKTHIFCVKGCWIFVSFSRFYMKYISLWISMLGYFPRKQTNVAWKIVLGRLLSLWHGTSFRDMLVWGGVLQESSEAKGAGCLNIILSYFWVQRLC